MHTSNEGFAAQAPHLQNLNPEQLAAVTHYEGPILVLAGAGSGKTRVLTRRVANLIIQHRVHPSKILAVTFTNKAAEEMRERLHALLGAAAKELWISTFHSAALRILRRHANLLKYTNDFAVYDEQDSRGLLKKIMKDMGIDDKKFPVQIYSRYIDQCKNSLILPDAALKQANNFADTQQAQVYERYQVELKRANAMDFGDLLVNALLLLKNFPDVLQLYRMHIHFVLVDEFQDTNKVQYLFIRYLSEPRKNLLVVGDDDQSIYAFRGATIRNILEFEKDYPDTKVVKLEQNYRSTNNVLTAAHAVIEKNTARKDKKLWTNEAGGEPITLFVGDTETDEAEFITRKIRSVHSAGLSYSKIAIFYRTNAQSRAIEESLISNKVPYKIFGGLKFYERKEIKDILGYLKLIVNPQDNQSFLRVINTPPRGIGDQSIQTLVAQADANNSSYMEVARSSTNKHVQAFVRLIEDLKALAENVQLSNLISDVIAKTEYGPKLKAMKDPTALSRVENLQEFVGIGLTMNLSAPTPFECLRLFLDRVSLTSSADLPNQESNENQKLEYVSLMTLHLAKGLEFPVVFLTGAEEGLLPHYRSILDENEIEEERRLCYVGITRAMRQLYITRARSRSMFSAGDGFGFTGSLREVSRFIQDIPSEVIQDVCQDFFDKAVQLGEVAFSTDFSSSNFNSAAIVRNKFQASARKTAGFSSPPSMAAVKTADQIQEVPNHKLWSEKFLPLAADKLAIGQRVIHPTFGPGIVEQIEAADSSPAKIKLFVKFDELEQAKKLIFKYAKLSEY